MLPQSTGRSADHVIHKLFLDHWAPRAMSGDAISQEDLMRLFEAARWAPSTFNQQPWRILYARRETEAWDVFFGLLVEGNKIWAKQAAALLLFISKTTLSHNQETSRTHAFDCGAAWENLSLQASLMGLVAHEMQGFDYDRAKAELAVPDGFQIQAMIAVGHPGRKENLPPALQAREVPSERRKMSDSVFEGRFPTGAK